MTQEKIPDWESELWSYISSGNGEHCPSYTDCQIRLEGGQCLDDSMKRFGNFGTHLTGIADSEFDLRIRELDKIDFKGCARAGRIFYLTYKLARKYIEEGNIISPPVPASLVELCDRNRTIEIREVPLKNYHGALWRLKDSWVIHLNENDTPSVKRFSLFHEAFHILAHSALADNNAVPVFRKTGIKQGSFNELLADHFAGCILMPGESAREKWAEVHNLDRMAETFQIPKSIAWFGLHLMGLL